MCEFQFLKGVQKAYQIEKELLGKGFTVRYYMPAELKPGDGVPYMKRRLEANPGMVFVGAVNLLDIARDYLVGSNSRHNGKRVQ